MWTTDSRSTFFWTYSVYYLGKSSSFVLDTARFSFLRAQVMSQHFSFYMLVTQLSPHCVSLCILCVHDWLVCFLFLFQWYEKIWCCTYVQFVKNIHIHEEYFETLVWANIVQPGCSYVHNLHWITTHISCSHYIHFILCLSDAVGRCKRLVMS